MLFIKIIWLLEYLFLSNNVHNYVPLFLFIHSQKLLITSNWAHPPASVHSAPEIGRNRLQASWTVGFLQLSTERGKGRLVPIWEEASFTTTHFISPSPACPSSCFGICACLFWVRGSWQTRGLSQSSTQWPLLIQKCQNGVETFLTALSGRTPKTWLCLFVYCHSILTLPLFGSLSFWASVRHRAPNKDDGIKRTGTVLHLCKFSKERQKKRQGRKNDMSHICYKVTHPWL